MAREFKPQVGGWTRYAPVEWQAALSFPTPVAEKVRGRMELSIGRLGAGKTTWSALRCILLANSTGRTLATNGIGWDEPWVCVSSFEHMEELRDCVFLWDELHLMMSGSKGLLGPKVERFLIRWLSLCRKRGICVVGTTQAWTRCATHYRQLVTTVWVCDALRPGHLHVARPFDSPDDGGRQSNKPQFYGPAAAHIPTNAEVWHGHEQEPVRGVAAGGAPATPTYLGTAPASAVRDPSTIAHLWTPAVAESTTA